MYFDTHCHLNSEEFDKDRDQIMQNCINNDITVIDIATSIDNTGKILEYADRYKNLYATTGIHPEEISTVEMNDVKSVKDDLYTLLVNKNIVAIGECGLDYYWLRKNGNLTNTEIEDIINLQKDLFRSQCELAKEFGLPLVIHTRAVEDEGDMILNDALEILESTDWPLGIFHSYTGSFDMAQRFLSMGYYISFNGIVTFKNSDNMRDMMKLCFESFKNQILFETDGPYLSPEGKRGQRNEPINVIDIYDFTSKALGYETQDIIADNVHRIFKIF